MFMYILKRSTYKYSYTYIHTYIHLLTCAYLYKRYRKTYLAA